MRKTLILAALAALLLSGTAIAGDVDKGAVIGGAVGGGAGAAIGSKVGGTAGAAIGGGLGAAVGSDGTTRERVVVKERVAAKHRDRNHDDRSSLDRRTMIGD